MTNIRPVEVEVTKIIQENWIQDKIKNKLQNKMLQ